MIFTILSSNQVARDELQLLIEVLLHFCYCRLLSSVLSSNMEGNLCDIHKTRRFGPNASTDWAQY
jgi:hypothetical protein